MFLLKINFEINILNARSFLELKLLLKMAKPIANLIHLCADVRSLFNNKMPIFFQIIEIIDFSQ